MKVTYSSLALAFVAFAGTSRLTEAGNLRLVRRLGGTYAQTGDYLAAMLARVNKERGDRGLPPVCSNKKLQSSSQQHSDDQAAANYMAHEGSDGSTMEQRITDAGYKWSAVGENVAAGQVDVEAVMDAWMNSPEHKENILGDYTMLGASYAFNEDSDFKHYWTQDFGKGDDEDCDFEISNGPGNQDDEGDNTQQQVAQNEDSVQDPPATEADTPCPGTEAPATVVPVEGPFDDTTEAPCADEESPKDPVKLGVPATEAPVDADTPCPDEDVPVVEQTMAPVEDEDTPCDDEEVPVVKGTQDEVPVPEAETPCPEQEIPVKDTPIELIPVQYPKTEAREMVNPKDCASNF